MKKRGAKMDPGVAASVLVILIALFVVIYIILLPQSERDELLDIEDDEIEDELEVSGEVLLSKAPGHVYSYEEYEHVKEISPISLFSRMESEITDLSDRAVISKSLFTAKEKEINFVLDNEVEEVLLYFLIVKGKGDLVVEVNDNVVYDGEADSSDIPIKIPGSYLGRNNRMVLSVGSFGLFGHKYELSDIKIVEKIKSEQKSSSRSFVVSSSEKANLKEAVLDYYVYCRDVAEVGRMEVSLNDYILMPEDVVVCEYNMPSLDIPLNYLRSGANILEFSIDKGDYRIEQMEVALLLKEKSFPKYDYYISEEDYEAILDNELDVRLGMLMEGDEKKAVVWLSADGKNINMDTEDDEFIIDISNHVELGQNLVQVIPKNDFYIESLKIWVE